MFELCDSYLKNDFSSSTTNKKEREIIMMIIVLIKGDYDNYVSD